MEMTSKERFGYWPNLTKKSFKKTSNITKIYNCIAWALNRTDIKYDSYGYYWPPNLDRDHTINGYINLYGEYGYERCSNGDYEPGMEKIAIFGDTKGLFTHVSLQLSNGKWTSKMGDLEDIEHVTPDVLSGGLYGNVMIYMKKKKT